MNKLFSVLFVMTVFCYGADDSVKDLSVASRGDVCAEVMGINNFDQLKKGSCIIYLDATTASDEEKVAAYQAIEGAMTQFEGQVPDSITINVGIANLELVDSIVAEDVSGSNQEVGSDRVIAVKDIKILEIVIDIACDQATTEEKVTFFGKCSTILVDLCNQLQVVANSIHGSITFDSPDVKVDKVLVAEEGVVDLIEDKVD